MLSRKQVEVVNCVKDENPKILVLSGAKRSGKTYIASIIFLGHMQKYRKMGLSFILGGATQASIRRNVLDDMELLLGKELKLDKSNAVEIFGNKVYCFDGANSDAWKKVRGFTAAGAYLNEGTALHDTFVKEVISRCSYQGARIYIDTNPENPMHSVKTDYIDKDGQRLKNGQLNIKAFHFTLFDNEALDPEYVESIVASTPSGMFTDRDIYGRWVNAQGIVYQDFDPKKHYISAKEISGMNFASYFAGVDWGYEHFGSIVLLGETDEHKIVLLKEYAEQHKEIDYWADVAKRIKSRYGDIPFYCDSARPEHVARFQREGLRAINANKAVISGIEEVAKRFKTGFLFVSNEVKRFKKEVCMYAWNESTGEPVKQYDDVLDSVRYAIYTHYDDSRRAKIYSKSRLGIY